MTATVDEDLMTLLNALDTRAAPPVAQPSDEPARGQSVEQWQELVGSARHAADALAVRHWQAVDATSTLLFGQTLSDVLPPADPALTRTSLSVAVPPVPELDDVVGELKGIAPHGPGARVPAPAAPHVRVHVTTLPRPSAAIIRLHGGAFWMGGGEVPGLIDGRLIDHLATVTGAAVLDVDYRLAPEFPFPAAIVDVLGILDALRDGLPGLDIDPRRIGLVGTSSGATTAVAAAMADAARHPACPLAASALIVPSLLLMDGAPDAHADPDGWSARQRQLRGYLGPALSASDPWVSPAVRTHLRGMPPTFAAIARFDEVARGGERLCLAIRAGGGWAQSRHYAMTHTTAAPQVEAAFIMDVADFLRGRLSDC